MAPPSAFRYVALHGHTHDDGLILERPDPTEHLACPKQNCRTDADQTSLNYQPGCIKVVDTFRDLPYGDEWVPLRVGSGKLRRVPFRGQHGEGEWCVGSGNRAVRVVSTAVRGCPRRGGVSNYEGAEDARRRVVEVV
jgi:hypothetical protein